MKQLIASVPTRAGILALSLLLTLLALTGEIENATTSAACLERAQFEMILCPQPPAPLVVPLLIGVVILLSAMLGGVARRCQYDGLPADERTPRVGPG
jgi:hypothetical protein